VLLDATLILGGALLLSEATSTKDETLAGAMLGVGLFRLFDRS
jgi:hypothetical protein